MKKLICVFLAALILSTPAYAVETITDDAIDIKAPSAILMEKTSGEVIYEKNAHEKRPPASVTKVMTLLLIVEAIERGDISLDDTVIASERAASFGGSCVYLEEGEKMSVDEMLKCITVVSANDCAVAMSEFLCGSEQAFVQRMNERAAELGLKDTHFCNCTGLFEDPEHYTSAYDLAVMSRALIKHDLIKKYSTIWMDSIRNGEFGLSNTNKLVYYYDGCTGLKTGSTSTAGYCVSATAEKDGMELIAVILQGNTSAQRFEDAKTLLNFGFATYALCPLTPGEALPPIPVTLGAQATVQPLAEEAKLLLEKAKATDLEQSLDLPERLEAPVQIGDRLGTLIVTRQGETVAEIPILAAEDVPRISWKDLSLRLLRTALFAGE